MAVARRGLGDLMTDWQGQPTTTTTTATRQTQLATFKFGQQKMFAHLEPFMCVYIRNYSYAALPACLPACLPD